MDVVTAQEKRPRAPSGRGGDAGARLPPGPCPSLASNATRPAGETPFWPAPGNQTPRGSLLVFLRINTTWFQHFGCRSKEQLTFSLAVCHRVARRWGAPAGSCTTSSGVRLRQTSLRLTSLLGQDGASLRSLQRAGACRGGNPNVYLKS